MQKLYRRYLEWRIKRIIKQQGEPMSKLEFYLLDRKKRRLIERRDRLELGWWC